MCQLLNHAVFDNRCVERGWKTSQNDMLDTPNSFSTASLGGTAHVSSRLLRFILASDIEGHCFRRNAFSRRVFRSMGTGHTTRSGAGPYTAPSSSPRRYIFTVWKCCYGHPRWNRARKNRSSRYFHRPRREMAWIKQCERHVGGWVSACRPTKHRGDLDSGG